MALKRYAGDRWSVESTDSPNRPTGVTTGAVVFETDTGNIFVYDGSSWVQASGASIALNSISDVDVASAANGSLLQLSGGTWVDVTGLAASVINSGTFADARISQSSVTQHEGALSIDYTQLTSVPAFLTDITGESITDLSDVPSVPASTDGVLFWDDSADALVWQTPALLADFVEGSVAISASQVTSGTFADARLAASNVTQFESSINHDNLLSFVTNEHIDHSGVTITAGDGLTGGGDITASRTINLDISALTVATSLTGTDEIPLHDGTGNRAISWTNLQTEIAIGAGQITSGEFADARISESSVTQHESAIDHDALTNFVANEHIDHSAVTLTAGEGLTGGGNITTSRTFALDTNGLTALTGNPADADSFIIYDASVAGHRKVTFSTFEGALTIPVNQITGLGDSATLNITGTDANVVSGTAGTNGNLVQWNADGDAVDSSIAASSVLTDNDVNTANGVCPLDSSGLVPAANLPSIAFTDVNVVADITARDALTGMSEGDVAVVNDASGDPAIDDGAASYIWDGSAWQLLKDPTDVSLTAPSAGLIPFGDGAGDQTSEAALAWDSSNDQLQVTGSLKLDEGGTVSTPSRGEAITYVETEVVSTDTITRVMQRLSNGDDVILASFIEPT